MAGSNALQLQNAAKVGPIYAASRNLGAAQALTANTDAATAIPSGAVGCLVWITASGSVVQGRYAWRDAATAITVTATSMGYLPAQASSHSIPLGMTHLHLACDQAAVGYITWIFGS